MKIRQDAWSHEDDVLLAETVLTHIKDGSTQLRAFDEVGDKLNRTSAACGFRWNAVVRQKHLNSIEESKRERKERKRSAGFTYYSSNKPVWAPASLLYPSPSQPNVHEDKSLDDIIRSLQSYAQSAKQHNNREELHSLFEENEQLKQQNYKMQQELQKIKQDNSIIEEDYQSLIQIMNRARRMAILEDEEVMSSAAFKMDKNGNLEKVAK